MGFLMRYLRYFGSRHFVGFPAQVLSQDALQGPEQARHPEMTQAALLQHVAPLGDAEAGHALGFLQHGDQGMQAGRGPQSGLAEGHTFLGAVLVEAAGGIQVQCIAAGSGRQPFQTPAPERSESGEIQGRGIEALEEAAQGRPTGDAGHGDETGKHHVTTEMGDVSQLSGTGKEVTHAMPLEESGESQETGTAGNLWVGEADWDGFIRRCESSELGHPLESRYGSGLRVLFSYTPSLHQTVTALLLHGCGSGPGFLCYQDRLRRPPRLHF